MNRAGIGLAVSSFSGGTLLLLIFYFSSKMDIAFVGYLFLIVAGTVNLCMLIVLMIKAIKDSNNRRNYLKTSGLMVLNIPVVIIYLFAFIFLTNTMRICFINETGKPITDIRIMGCATKFINKLDINESKTCWIDIPGDCSITIEYKLDGKMKREEVFNYVTNSMGQRVTYRIGTQSKPIDETF